MRVSASLGLLTLVGLVACSANDVDSPAAHTSPNGPEDPATPDGLVSTTDPTEPADTAAAPSPTNPEAPPAPVAKGIAITDVGMFQVVRVPVVKDGAVVAPSSRNAPIVAQKEGLLRVSVEPDGSFEPREVTAELRISSASGKKYPIIRETKTIAGASKEEDPRTTFNLAVPAASLPQDATFKVTLSTSDGEKLPEGTASDARFPRDGSLQDLGVVAANKVTVVVVPFRYDADGSGRMPDMSETQMALYKKVMLQRYPASEVEVKAHAPYPWSTRIGTNGGGFQDALREMHQLRQKDGVASDVYYYGVFAPNTSFKSYCQSSCVTGLSLIVDADDAPMRASVGLGFTGQESADTMAHEVGHAHGRAHAPCGGPQGVDPQYPYPRAELGVWGYDVFGKRFIPPNKGRDMMGYCQNLWVSDYTYKALFNRISAVGKSKSEMRSISRGPTQYSVASVGEGGELTWNGDLDLDDELTGGEALPTKYISEAGVEMFVKPGRFYRFDHLPGGFVMIPKESATPWKAVRVEGFMKDLARASVTK